MTGGPGLAGSAFTWTHDGDGVATVLLRVPGLPDNRLRPGHAGDLSRVVAELTAAPGVRALVLASGVPGCFCAGLDLGALDAISTAHDGSDVARAAQQALERLAATELPMVAALDGPCLGVGLELALVAAERVATPEARTRLGHPAIELGLIPAAGGTQRLPAVVAPDLALELLCSGRWLTAREALECGLLDELVDRARLLEVARARALALVEGRRRRSGLLGRWWPAPWHARTGRGVAPRSASAFRAARRRWEAEGALRSRAVAWIIDAMVEGIEHGARAGQEVERRAFGELIASHEVTHRRAVWLDRAQVRRSFALPRGAAKLGAWGIVGGDALPEIVEASVLAGLGTYVVDAEAGALDRVRGALAPRLAAALATGRITAEERERALARVRLPADESARRELRLVVVGGDDGSRARDRVERDLAPRVGRDTAIVIAAANPATPLDLSPDGRGRRLGLRYLPAVGARRLAEIVAPPGTGAEAVSSVAELVSRQGWTPLIVSDAPGGLGLRLLVALVGEALHLVAEGIAVPEVDAALLDWGFAVGPLALLDDVGWQPLFLAAHHLVHVVHPRFALPPAATELYAQGRRGRPSGGGAYRYDARGRRRGADPGWRAAGGARARAPMPREIVDRGALRIAIEAIVALDEAVVRTPEAVAVASVDAAGFPPGRGGPLRHVDAVGARRVVERLEELARQHGPRFTPPRGLVAVAQGDGSLTRSPVGPVRGSRSGA